MYVYIRMILGMATTSSSSGSSIASGISQDKYAVLLSDVSEHDSVRSPMASNNIHPFTPGQLQGQEYKNATTVEVGSGGREGHDNNDEISITLNDANL